jgi:hypothetical protein
MPAHDDAQARSDRALIPLIFRIGAPQLTPVLPRMRLSN